MTRTDLKALVATVLTSAWIVGLWWLALWAVTP